MSGQIIATDPGRGGPIGSQRFVPDLPAGIPILPEQAPGGSKRTKPLPAAVLAFLVFLLILVLMALLRLSIWYSDTQKAAERKRDADDNKVVFQAVTKAMLAHPQRGTRIAVMLSGGPGIVEVESAFVQRPVRKPPTTCVSVSVINPLTGARHSPPLTCIPGLAYEIKQ